MLATISFVQTLFLILRILIEKGVIKLCVTIMTHVRRNTMIIVNVVATRKKNMIMIGVKKTTIMMIITNAEKIATKVVVRKNPVIVLINSGKKISPHACEGCTSCLWFS